MMKAGDTKTPAPPLGSVFLQDGMTGRDLEEFDRKLKERIANMSLSSSQNSPSDCLSSQISENFASAFGSALGKSSSETSSAAKKRSQSSVAMAPRKEETATGFRFPAISSPSALTINLENLVKEGREFPLAILVQLRPERIKDRKLSKEYQKRLREIDVRAAYKIWYKKASIVVWRLLSARLFEEFQSHYQYPLNLSDAVGRSRRFTEVSQKHISKEDAFCLVSGCPLIEAQCEILEQAKLTFDLQVATSTQSVQSDLFDAEIDVARKLNGDGFCQAAGAIAGVVLKQHLAAVMKTHLISFRKRHLSINDCGRQLKDNGIADLPTARLIQRLGDLWNLYYGAKGKEPGKEDVDELITGVDRIIKTVF